MANLAIKGLFSGAVAGAAGGARGAADNIIKNRDRLADMREKARLELDAIEARYQNTLKVNQASDEAAMARTRLTATESTKRSAASDAARLAATGPATIESPSGVYPIGEGGAGPAYTDPKTNEPIIPFPRRSSSTTDPLGTARGRAITVQKQQVDAIREEHFDWDENRIQEEAWRRTAEIMKRTFPQFPIDSLLQGVGVAKPGGGDILNIRPKGNPQGSHPRYGGGGQ